MWAWGHHLINRPREQRRLRIYDEASSRYSLLAGWHLGKGYTPGQGHNQMARLYECYVATRFNIQDWYLHRTTYSRRQILLLSLTGHLCIKTLDTDQILDVAPNFFYLLKQHTQHAQHSPSRQHQHQQHIQSPTNPATPTTPTTPATPTAPTAPSPLTTPGPST